MVIRHGGLTAAERVKKAVEVCKDRCSPYCPYWTEDECRTLILTDCEEAIAERDERIAIMQESMEALEKRCNALEVLEQRCKALEKRLDDSDRINVVRCSECQYWNPPTYAEQEDGSTVGHCTAALNEQQTDAYWFCADGVR